MQESARRQYRLLPDDTRRLLTVAAADPELTCAELLTAAAALGLSAADLEPAELAGQLEITGPAITFRPATLRSVAYHDAPLARRLAAHAVLAEVTCGLRALTHRAAGTPGRDDELARALVEASTTAGHAAAADACERAADLFSEPGPAADALVEAARRCWRAGWPARARRLLHRAGQCRGAAPARARAQALAGAIRLRDANTGAAREDLLAAAQHLLPYDLGGAVDALLIAGDSGHLAGEHDRFRTVARRVLAERRGDEPAPLDLAFSQVAGLAALVDGDHATGFAQLRRVLRLADRVDDPAALIRAATAGLLVGDGPRASELAARAAMLARDRGDGALLPAALQAGSFAGLAGGHYETATALATEGMAAARALGHPATAESHLAVLAVLAAMVGDRATALMRVREARAEQPGQPRAFCEWALALLDLVAARPRPAAARLQQIVGSPPGLGDPVIQVAATPHLVEAVARAGGAGPRTAPPAGFDRWAVATGRPDWLALRDRCAALTSDDESAADDHFRTALRRHRAGSDDFARAHTQLLYGRELRRHRRPAAAREHLREAAETFRLLDAGPWAVQAESELRAAGDTPHRVRPGTAALTAQQEHIAQLVADGATNREVAQQMLLSPRTVDHHLRNVFARLGVRSRTELARVLPARDR